MSKIKSIEETYIQKDPIEHIKDLPDTYIGSIERAETKMWVWDDEKNMIVYKSIDYIAGLYKIFDEIIVNSIDQYTRLNQEKKVVNKLNVIKVDIDKKKNEISIYNNGEGIPVVIHKEHNIYVAEMIFGKLLTSANYDKNEKKITGGKNGYGSKLTNIFSKKFIIETVDSNNKLKYIQTFSDNMGSKTKPKVTKYSGKPYTKITFQPDLKIFGLKELDDDTISLMKRRVYDITACTGKDVNVYLNNKKIDCKSLEKYSKYYFDHNIEKIYEVCENKRWEVLVVINNDGKFDQVSFVNGINTKKGGKHVDNVVNHICRKLQNQVKSKGYKRKKNIKVSQAHIKENMFVFVRSIIENPSFDSQIKEFLTTPHTKFGSKFTLSNKNLEKLAKTSLIERALKLSEFKESLIINKVTSKKNTTLRGIPKLDDANKAGGKESNKCTLILTEGDSAKALAISGLSVVGRDYYGVFPLRGKLLNARSSLLKKVVQNKEISNIMKILGLTIGIFGKEKNKEKRMNILKNKLRYGRVLIFTDQDVDGSHIKGLVINMFHSLWPELLEFNNFIISLATPIIKVKNKKKEKQFYTIREYENWKEKQENLKNWNIKYYKGLGTSTSKEAKEYFTDFEKKKIEYIYSEDYKDEKDGKEKNECKESLELAFLKEKANDRKKWLKNHDKNKIIEQTEKKVTYKRFINYEFRHFSNYDCERSLACICDGLKPSLRKILYSVLKRNLKNEIKVAQLAGYVSEHACYHHGETSLYECIIGMAQNYVGSNNIELLVPNGQFGTRLQGGKDASAPRYIWTKMDELTPLIFHPDDSPLLDYKIDDGIKVEPNWYIPIIPMILVNGTEGIGTGFSTKVPAHNPLDIIDNLINLMNSKKIKDMKPWYRGFKGDINFKAINDLGNYIYINKGKYEKINNNTLEINELPIGTWTDKYRDFLETLLYSDKTSDKKKNQCLVNFKSYYTESDVKFVLKFKGNELNELINDNLLESRLKLTDQKATSYGNINLYNSKGEISSYNSSEQILKEFYLIRLAYYIKRKEYLLKKIKKELDIYKYKIKFIEEFINKTIDIINQEDELIYKQLIEKKYPKMSINKEKEESYDYLLNMYIRTLTKKKMLELKKLFTNKENEYNILKGKTEKMLWKEDLTKFKKAYNKKMKKYEKENNNKKKDKIKKI